MITVVPPLLPGSPCGPGEPGAPGEPGSPFMPSGPGVPGLPFGPSGPGAPAGPGGPALPGAGAGTTTVSFFSQAPRLNAISTTAAETTSFGFVMTPPGLNQQLL